MIKIRKHILIFLLTLLANVFAYSQSCTVNAGGNKAICGTTTALSGSSSGTTGSPTWSLVSKPSGATDPIITNGNTLAPSISGLNSSGNYVFRISQTCSGGGTATSDVTITAPGAITGFTAGADITTIPATTGVATLGATIPAGYTASWTYYNLYYFQRFGAKVTTNATITNATTATPTLTLTKKSDHDIDPSYVAVLRITSTANPTCFYEDEAIVRFIPNPRIIVTSPTDYCVPPTGQFNIFLTSASPKFAIYPSQTPGSAGTTTTTMTMNVVSQPAGGNIGINYYDSNFINLSGVNVTGTYKFTITISNSTETYTTPEITFNYNGSQPRNVILTDPAYPDQMGVYFATGSAGAVYCNKAGTTDPIVVGFKIDPLDPATIITNFTNSGITPPGGSPTIVTAGSGTYNRTATITPPSGGWRVGTYKFNIDKSNGTCNASPQNYYIHISDSSRPNVSVNDVTVCYPGSGSVAATIGLPAIYKGVVNTSYFQDFGAHYDLSVVSKPVGSGTPTFEATNLRTITSTSTVIGNLTTQGAYVFRIRAIPTSGGVADFLGKEYACAGTSLEDTFTVNVTTQINSNAGSDFTTAVGATTTLNGNNPTPSTGLWTVVSSPAGSTPTFVNASLYNTQVNGLTATGNYVFRWTISTGSCTSSDDVQINAVVSLLDAVNDTFNPVVAGSTTTTSVIANDKNISGGQAVIGTSEGQVSIATSGTWPTGFTLNSNGTITVASTVTPGTYNMNYTICNQISGAPCDTATVAITVPAPPVCYESPTDTSSSVPVKHGITVLGRAGADNGNWPMLRNSAYTALEGKTKGFVITRVTSDPAQTSAANHINKITVPETGMMVFDTYEDAGKGCLKIYTGTTWKCFNKQGCP